jgi:hypothetical protein
MADGGDGFVGRCEIVEPRRRGKRLWPDEVKGRIVAYLSAYETITKLAWTGHKGNAYGCGRVSY